MPACLTMSGGNLGWRLGWWSGTELVSRVNMAAYWLFSMSSFPLPFEIRIPYFFRWAVCDASFFSAFMNPENVFSGYLGDCSLSPLLESKIFSI